MYSSWQKFKNELVGGAQGQGKHCLELSWVHIMGSIIGMTQRQDDGSNQCISVYTAILSLKNI